MVGRCRSAALVLLAVAVAAFAGAAVAPSGNAAGRAPASAARTCSPGYVHASLSWGEKCLQAGQFCKVGNPEYHRYGFDCPAGGHLVRSAGTTPGATKSSPEPQASSVSLGRSVPVRPRRRTGACRRSALPDVRCSPGAYYSKLTTAVICSAGFRTSTIRDVPQSEKFAVEREYGLPARLYGRSLEIDHIIPLELGGSNAITNLFPEPGSGRWSYHVKDRLENVLHERVCAGRMPLLAARRSVATNWERLDERLLGTA
jgi:hypothetical protein